MDGFKTSRYITLSGLPVRCCVAGQRGCRLCELHEYIKGALPRTCYTVMLTNKFRPCSFIMPPNGHYVDIWIMNIDSAYKSHIDRIPRPHDVAVRDKTK